MQAIHMKKSNLANGAPNQALIQRIARSDFLIQVSKFSNGFRNNAAPATLIKPERNIVRNRVACPDIEVKTPLLPRKGE